MWTAVLSLIDLRALDIYQVDLSRNGFIYAMYIKQRIEEIGIFCIYESCQE